LRALGVGSAGGGASTLLRLPQGHIPPARAAWPSPAGRAHPRLGHPVLRPLQQSGWPEARREWVRRPRCFWLRTRGMGAVGQLEACEAARPSDLEAAVSVGGSSRSPGQLEASPR